MPGKFVVKKGPTGKFRFSLVSTNGQVVVSSQAYETKRAAWRDRIRAEARRRRDARRHDRRAGARRRQSRLRKPAAKKPAPKRPAAKKPAAKKPAARK